jgi:hypothetical protein
MIMMYLGSNLPPSSTDRGGIFLLSGLSAGVTLEFWLNANRIPRVTKSLQPGTKQGAEQQ